MSPRQCARQQPVVARATRALVRQRLTVLERALSQL